VHSPDVHSAIERLTFDYARGIDDRDWVTFRSVFTDICEFDFRSWSGAPSTSMASDVWVQAVRSVTGAFDATQHLMSNLRLDAASESLDGARVIIGTNEVQAQHWFDGATMAAFDRSAEPAWCTLGGVFTNRYVRTEDEWRIAACRFTLRWRTGDETLFALARQRS
jgi:hypothetical protein